MNNTASSLACWLQAIRPRTLPAALAPVFVATGLAVHAHAFSPSLALAMAGCAVSLQILSNLANDLFDALAGIDTEHRVGPTRVVQSGLVSVRAMVLAMVLAGGLGLACAAVLVAAAGWPLVVLAVAAVLTALAYSGGPYPLASHGLGEVAAFVFFGPVAVVGGLYAYTLGVPPAAWLVGAICGLPVAAIMLVNNHRDRATDGASGKYTLAIRLGEARTLGLYRALLLCPLALALGTPLVGLPPLCGALPLALLPVATHLHARMRRERGPALNALLADTARYALAVSVAVGLPLYL